MVVLSRRKATPGPSVVWLLRNLRPVAHPNSLFVVKSDDSDGRAAVSRQGRLGMPLPPAQESVDSPNLISHPNFASPGTGGNAAAGWSYIFHTGYRLALYR